MEMKDIHQCVECGRWLRYPRKHVDTCGKRCARSQLRKQQQALLNSYKAEEIARKPKYYECGICGHIHPWNWNSDCRDDKNRFTLSELEDANDDADIASWEERLVADGTMEG